MFVKNKRVLIFLNRKLISYDHIIPFLFELKKYYSNACIEIWFPDFDTYSEIKKNEFLFDTGNSIAKFYIISSAHHTNIFRMINKITISLMLLNRLFAAIFFPVTFIHYKLLDYKPFSVLKYFNKRNTFLAENDAYGYTQLMEDTNYLENRPLNPNIHNINFLQFIFPKYFEYSLFYLNYFFC